MLYAWLLVGAAVVAETSAAISLRFSKGFTRPLPTAFALAAFGAAFYVVSVALIELPVSTVYPAWAGGGTACVALIGVLVLREQAGAAKGIGVALIVAGIVILNIASGAQES